MSTSAVSGEPAAPAAAESSSSRSASPCSSRRASRGSSDDEEEEDRAAAAQGNSGSDEERFASGPPLTQEQEKRAAARLQQRAAELLQHGGQPLPSRLARALRVLVAQKHPSLLRVVHHFSLQDGSNPDGAAALPSPLPGAPPRTVRPPRRLDAAELASLRQREADHLWRVAAASLQGDMDRVFARCSLLDAKELAAADRALSQVDGLCTVYGEANFCSLAAVLARHWKDLQPGQGHFVDLGSGSGRALVGAHLLHDFARITGVEILRGLTHESTKVVHHRLQRVLKKELEEREMQRRAQARELGVEPEVSEDDAPPPPPCFTIHHADFRDVDWSSADVLFVNSTVFNEELMLDLSLLARRLRPGALIITYTHALWDEDELEDAAPDGGPPRRHYRLLSDDSYEQSWGHCTVHVQRKRSHPCWDPVTKSGIEDIEELEKVAPDLPRELTQQFRVEQVMAQKEQEN